jgi:hypothetical protein
MTSRPAPYEKGKIPDELVDAFFDRELDGASREQFFGAMRADLSRCAEVAKTQRIVSLLREPVEAPDLTGAIMAEVRRRGAFVPTGMRRFVKYGRWAAAVLLAAGVLGLALVHRHSPDALRLAPRPKPVAGVIQSGSSDAAAGVQQLTQAMNVVAARVLESEGGGRGAGKRGQRMISIGLTPGSTSVRLPGEGGGAIVVYTGTGGERFVVPDAIYFDRSSAMVLPLGQISPSKGQDWMAISPENPFLLPSVRAPAADPREPNVRIVK